MTKPHMWTITWYSLRWKWQ